MYDAMIIGGASGLAMARVLSDGERRRLYTACSRALHAVALLAGGGLIKELGLQ